MKKSIIIAITNLICIVFFSPNIFSSDIKEAYKNCIFKEYGIEYYQKGFCDETLYTQPASNKAPHTQPKSDKPELDVVKCGRKYRLQNEQRVIICHGCYRYSPYNSYICASDRNAYATKIVHKGCERADESFQRFEGTAESFPSFLSKFAGNDVEEMLLKEREMFKKGFRAIYHVCNTGHFKYISPKYVSPLFLYQLFGILDFLGKGLDVNSSEVIPCIPRYNNFAFDKVPNRESFIELIQSSREEGDCNADVRSVGLVGVAALSGCYHHDEGGVVFSRYITPKPINSVPHPKKIIMNALKSSKIRLPLTEMKNVTKELRKLAKDFKAVDSALLQIFLSEDAFLNHVCYAKNSGIDIRPIDEKSIKDGKHLEPDIQLNVYLPPSLVTNQEKCNIHLYTRWERQNTPIPQANLIEFKMKVRNIIDKYRQ